MHRRVTAGERDSLIAAYLGCRTWHREADVIVGEHAGWRIWLSTHGDSTAGFATSKERDVTVELTPPVIRAWLARVLERFLQN